MRKSILALSLAAAFSMPTLVSAQTAPAAAPASPHTLTGNVSLVSDYRFRGISQTYKDPAVQGGFDYSHSSGAYLGTWASNVSGSLVNGPSYFNGSMEWDFYGGYKPTFGDFGLDVGAIYYYYPGARYPNTTKDKYDNFEAYLGGSWKWISAKVYYTLSDYFGTKTSTYGGYCGVSQAGGGTFIPGSTCAPLNPGGSRGSTYWDLTANYEIADKTNLIGHLGRQKVKNYGTFNYTDWKIGVTKEYVGLTWGASLIGTNANKNWWKAVKVTGSGFESRNPGDTTLVLSVSKTF